MPVSDTIVAQATPPGRGGVGIIRISGQQNSIKNIAEVILGTLPPARYAHYGNFMSQDNQLIDIGIALYFPNPHSFTGEDVLELQGHGGPVVMDSLCKEIIQLGARLARPGEFSERAFLNDKLDLSQAEAIADLIDSGSEQAARSAIRSLQGDFSSKINKLCEQLIQLRMYVEAAIDFPEEEVDFLADGRITNDLESILSQCQQIRRSAKQGVLLQEGMTVVIAGKPNAGKSSLLNQLSGRETAIVTDIAGTTRDLLRESIQIDGIPVNIIDTAGLRETDDIVEQEGVRRAWDEILNADKILLMVDASQSEDTHPDKLWPAFSSHNISLDKITVLRNKIDLLADNKSKSKSKSEYSILGISAKTGLGIDELRTHLKQSVGAEHIEGAFIARRRHLDAMDKTIELLQSAFLHFKQNLAGELLAEDLRLAHDALSEITGQFTSDDLLGCIFSSFCIGK